jgi:hypothetical protein
MRAGKQILALTEPGSDLASAVHDYSRAIVVPTDNVSAIRDALHEIRQETLIPPIESAETDPTVWPYSANRGAELLAGLLERITVSETVRSAT